MQTLDGLKQKKERTRERTDEAGGSKYSKEIGERESGEASRAVTNSIWGDGKRDGKEEGEKEGIDWL